MQVFVLERIDHATERYHEEGGVVVVARDEAHAKELVAALPHCKPTDAEWASAVVYDVQNDATPRVFVFPDSGCC